VLTGEPVYRFTITPLSADADGWSGTKHPLEEPLGRFRLTGLDPARMYVVVSAPGYASWRSRDAELQSGEHEFDVALGALRTVELELCQRDGTPLGAPARARFERLDGTPQWVESPTTGGESSHAELIRGKCRVSGLPADRVRAIIDVAGLGDETFELDLRVEPDAPVVLRLSEE
jgi:hypothetical protein